MNGLDTGTGNGVGASTSDQGQSTTNDTATNSFSSREVFMNLNKAELNELKVAMATSPFCNKLTVEAHIVEISGALKYALVGTLPSFHDLQQVIHVLNPVVKKWHIELDYIDHVQIESYPKNKVESA